MKYFLCLALLWSVLLPAETARREVVYGNAATIGGQVIPLFDKGYLIYLHQPNRLQVFRPDTQLAYEYDVPCPAGSSRCSAGGIAATRKGIVAIGIAYASGSGYTSGIRFLNPAGKETGFIETGRYVPMQLAFDKNGNLWSIGWERDAIINDSESKEPYNIVHKYSPEGKPLSEHLPSTLWTSKRGPALGGRGYWTMYAAEDRIGAIFNKNVSNRTPEWVEWDLNGVVLARTPLSDLNRGRAFGGNGRLYAQFPLAEDGSKTELKMLETSTGKWLPVPNQPSEQAQEMLLGADGQELVYRINRGGNLHLLWARPDFQGQPEH